MNWAFSDVNANRHGLGATVTDDQPRTTDRTTIASRSSLHSIVHKTGGRAAVAVLQRPLTLLPATGRGSDSSESMPLSSGYSGYVQPLAGLHLPTRDGCQTSTSVHQLLSSTQFGFVQPQVSALVSDTAGAGAQWSSVANDAVASSSTA